MYDLNLTIDPCMPYQPVKWFDMKKKAIAIIEDSNTNGTPETITGYDIVAIQNALIGCSTWNEWKNNVKSLYTGNKNDVESLFNYWYNF